MEEILVPDRGSGNPTPLGGMGPPRARCTLGHGELQARQPHCLGLQVSPGMGDEIPFPHPWRGRGPGMDRLGSSVRQYSALINDMEQCDNEAARGAEVVG